MTDEVDGKWPKIGHRIKLCDYNGKTESCKVWQRLIAVKHFFSPVGNVHFITEPGRAMWSALS